LGQCARCTLGQVPFVGPAFTVGIGGKFLGRPYLGPSRGRIANPFQPALDARQLPAMAHPTPIVCLPGRIRPLRIWPHLLRGAPPFLSCHKRIQLLQKQFVLGGQKLFVRAWQAFQSRRVEPDRSRGLFAQDVQHFLAGVASNGQSCLVPFFARSLLSARSTVEISVPFSSLPSLFHPSRVPPALSFVLSSHSATYHSTPCPHLVLRRGPSLTCCRECEHKQQRGQMSISISQRPHCRLPKISTSRFHPIQR
jgi:hypothetical protein